MTVTGISDNDNVIDYNKWHFNRFLRPGLFDCNKWHFNRFLNPYLSRLPVCIQRAISYKYLVALPLNLVLNIHLRIFAYASNVLIASFEYVELMLASSTLKNFRFLLKSRLSTDRAPVIKLICFTFQPCHCITVLMALRRDAYWSSDVLLTLTRYRSQQSDILLCSKIQKVPTISPTGGRTAIPSGRIRQKLFFTIVSLGIPSLILLFSTGVSLHTHLQVHI
jgi:hypothetical protein